MCTLQCATQATLVLDILQHHTAQCTQIQGYKDSYAHSPGLQHAVASEASEMPGAVSCLASPTHLQLAVHAVLEHEQAANSSQSQIHKRDISHLQQQT